MSMVKMVEDELKMDVSEDMRAASITASIMPLKNENFANELLHQLAAKWDITQSPSMGLGPQPTKKMNPGLAELGTFHIFYFFQ